MNGLKVFTETTLKTKKLTHSQTEMSIYKFFYGESGRLSVPTRYPDLKPQQVACKAQE